MDDDFAIRAARVARRAGPERRNIRRSGGETALFMGVLVGAGGMALVIFANENYATTDEMAPFVMGAAGYMVIAAGSLLIGILMALFRRWGWLCLTLGQLFGWAVAVLDVRIAGGIS